MSFSSDSPDAKKPCKGILKSSSSFDKHSAASSVHRKSAKFDELNVLQTYHPPDKDYGHMKVDEPKTPFNYVEAADVDQLDAEVLAERLRVAADARSDAVSEEELDDDDEEEEEEELTEEQKKRKLEFERRRKAHYNEFEAVKLARKLIEEDDEEEEDDAADGGGADDGPNKADDEPSANNTRPTATGGSSSTPASKDETRMEIEEQEDETDRNASSRPNKVGTAESPAARLKPVSSAIRLEENSDFESPRSSVIALIMIVSICLMIFFIVCFTLLFYLLKRNI
ncbi:protein phosphatase inhibitor 2 [Anopheles funestus]|uniref:Protein phosphatase inhibitor 2 n=1 Tax=Anopheles funestus TaxID=62324 RepID=A0A182R2A4_ANOFN|nr:protein phosphatase inhibitor 2 [Anopheles funestus]